MQGKVSMVMPCYNKAEYIGEMFDSIIAQEWDNIELVLVNDGSTDGTREIISGYEPKFLARGFEVVIVDQKNAGVCAAAKAGLERITGDYVCMVDADDELDPGYVSVMASWLENNKNYDFAICEGINYTGRGCNKVFSSFKTSDIGLCDQYHVHKYLLGAIRSTPWIYMVRFDYFKLCNVVPTYFTDTRGSHEPGYIIPLLSFGGKYKYFSMPLYRFNINDEGHSRSPSFEKMKFYHEEYDRLCKIAISLLPSPIVDESKKQKLTAVSEISKLYRIGLLSGKYLDMQEETACTFKRISDIFISNFTSLTELPEKMAVENGEPFIWFVINYLTGTENLTVEIPRGEVIGYGAMGKEAKMLLPLLRGTQLEPDILWDIKANGEGIQAPDIDSLDSGDTVLVFPVAKVDQDMISSMESRTGLVMLNTDIKNWLAAKIYTLFESSLP